MLKEEKKATWLWIKSNNCKVKTVRISLAYASLWRRKKHLNTNGTIQKLFLITQRQKGYKGKCKIYFSSI